MNQTVDHSHSKDAKLPGIAYKELFALSAHYSNKIFEARLLIIGAAVVGWGMTTGVYAFGGAKPLTDAAFKSYCPYVAALAVAALSFLEATYLQMYWAVFEAGKAIEATENNRGYFTSRDLVYLPFLAIYAINIGGFLLKAFVNSVHINLAPVWILFSFACIPVAILVGTWQYLKPRSGKRKSRTKTKGTASSHGRGTAA